jgi:hypothetical protein
VVDRFVAAKFLAELFGQLFSTQGVVVIFVDTTYVVSNLSVLGWQLWFVVIAVSGKAQCPSQQAFGKRGLQTLVKGGAVWIGQCSGTGYALPDI